MKQEKQKSPKKQSPKKKSPQKVHQKEETKKGSNKYQNYKEEEDDDGEELLRKAANANNDQELGFNSKNQTPLKSESQENQNTQPLFQYKNPPQTTN